MNWLKFRTDLNKAIKFALPMVDGALAFSKEPGVLSGVRLALQTKNAFNKVYQSDEKNFTNDGEWDNIPSGAFERYFFNLLIKKGATIRQSGGDIRCHWIEISGHVYGYHKRDVPWLYVRRGDEAGWNYLKEIFWESVGNKVLINKNDKIEILLYEENRTYSTEVAEKYTREIGMFRKCGYGRSYILYGRPGTGKSNIAASILNNLGCRTMIINNASGLDNIFIRSNVEQLGVEAIVIEDMDHMGTYEANKFLDSLQYLSDRGLLIIGTCNRIKSLELALVRRFNEAIEVNNLPEEVIRLFVADEEIIGMVGNFTVNLLVEVKRRIEVLGREETINRMGDLVSICERGNTDEYKL